MTFLETWRETLRSELRTNASRHLPHRYNQLANNIPADFPDLSVVNLYLHPIVVEGPTTMFLPALQKITSAGVMAALAIEEGALPPQSASLIKSIVGNRSHKSTGYLAELRLTLSLDPNILTSALQAITGRRDPREGSQTAVTTWLTSALPKVHVWVLKAMLEHISPVMVLDYICAQSDRTARQRKRTLQLAIDASQLAINASQLAIDASQPSIASSSSAAPANQEGHVMNPTVNRQQSLTPSKAKNGLRRAHEKRYTTMSTTYQGKEVLELISDSDGEF
ncbi:XPGI domain-containing protein [Mycena venus]|uniref:XPGI domain-containing protein n=1 Tax=Mycena venus TaxID=2733690 RepID=A0A8H7CN67_9AGAR|nr:XPGI domain-containing protein [Mycena venus]